MHLGLAHYVRADTRTLNINGKDAVRARRSVIHGRLAHDAIRVAQKQKIQRLFFIHTWQRRQAIELNVPVHVVHHGHLRQVFESPRLVAIIVQQVKAFVIVQLEVGNVAARDDDGKRRRNGQTEI